MILLIGINYIHFKNNKVHNIFMDINIERNKSIWIYGQYDCMFK